MCLHRDLGTALYHLQVLWMTRCSLRDLSGVSNFSSLKVNCLGFRNLHISLYLFYIFPHLLTAMVFVFSDSGAVSGL